MSSHLLSICSILLSAAMLPTIPGAGSFNKEDIRVISSLCDRIALQDKAIEQYEIDIEAHGKIIQILCRRLASLEKAEKEYDDNRSKWVGEIDELLEAEIFDSTFLPDFRIKRLEQEKKDTEQGCESLAQTAEHAEEEATRPHLELVSKDEEPASENKQLAKHAVFRGNTEEFSAGLDRLRARIQSIVRQKRQHERQVEERQKQINDIKVQILGMQREAEELLGFYVSSLRRLLEKEHGSPHAEEGHES